MDLEVAHAIAPDAQQGRRQRPSHRARATAATRRSAQMLEDGRPAVSRRGVELLDRLGLRQADHRGRSGAGPVGAGDRALARHDGVQRQRRPRGPGVQGRRGLVVAAGRRRRRAGLGRVAARDGRRRRHHAVDRRQRRMAGRAGLVRRSAVAGHRRRGVVVVRPSAMAARGDARQGPDASADTRCRRGRRPVHRRADRVQPTSNWSAAAPPSPRRSGPGWRR